MELTGKVAVVTGGSRGIGRAVTTRLAEAGAEVVLTFRADATAAVGVVDEIRAKGGRVLAVQADSAETGAMDHVVERAVGRSGRLDVLVNNAAELVVAPLEELDAAAFDRIVATNVRAPFLAARAAARHMGEGGRIITIGSNMIGRTVFPGFALYSLSKTALVGMTKGLSRDLGPRGITANLVNPGPIDTDLNPSDGPQSATIAGFTTLGRYGRPEEIADMVVHLAGPGAAYVTGAAIDVDGGFTV
ncbi:SDR family NAD(P)-dependent oxidoreductase [Pseudonocardia humida]|uniref:SDR family oxidoreductase n=1 Tax=Pseudonocardia humida TaxID=2800819 RepID=A0ABT0ZVM7_9PSEU|nr:SDR family oxidoreductase [Pseudonocardia humida]MCO1654725.1 SDR family oxidoreductase [Pseudonocardia humida]